jgi:assimilatory nitrate reductase catalytic subunit
MSSSLKARARGLLHAPDGVLTRDLLRVPGRFGLGQVPERLSPEATTALVCGFCSTGCSLQAHLRQGAAINLTPDPDYPVNLGMACPKGWEALAPLAAADRAVTPLLRGPDGALRPVDWPAALDAFVHGMRGVQERHGPAAAAFLGTGQLPIEELAFLGALCKFGMGMIHGDGNTRQCMATSVVAYKESFGFDAPPYTYEDFEQSDVLVFVGANPCIAHPILWERVCRNRNNPSIVVLDPRRTETAQAATEHFALRPKSDLVLLYALANVLVREGFVDRAFIDQHTTGFEPLCAHVAAFTPERAAAESGIPVERIEWLARAIHEGERVSFWWTMGVNQSHQGVRTAQAIINLALLTGNIGRPGTGANSITGQCNAMGSRLFSNTTNLLGGHQFDRLEHRQKVARALDIDVGRIPDRGSYAYDQIMEGILRGEIRALWIVATNTSHSWINQHDAREVLDRLEFLVVQDMYATTETVAQADLVLPAAGWGEKEGVFINSERRLGLIKQVARAPGKALSDFRIFQLLAEAWGVSELFSRWRTPEDVFQLLKECSRGMPCDITGVRDYAMLEALGGVQWPLPEGASVEKGAQRRLFEDGRFFTADGRARLIVDEPRPMPEAVRPEYPFVLLTGRGSSSQWHTETRTAKSDVLRKLSPGVPYAEINPEDAARLGIRPTDWVRIASQRGHIDVRAFITHVVPLGQVFVPMHSALTNRLTFPAFDPHSRQPAYKGCAVSVQRVDSSMSRS